MATQEDWAMKAATELAHISYALFGSLSCDSYVTDEQFANVAKRYKDVILERCPFEVDRAYMQVPRCDTCKHWTRDVDPTGKKQYSGICYNPELMALGSGQTTGTSDTYGCVQWEAKP